MTTNFYYSVIIGFFLAGLYRYIMSQGWALSGFLKTDWKAFLKAAGVTAAAGYFAHDVCAALSGVEAIASLNPCGTLESAPRLAGFAIGALGGTTDLLVAGMNLIELVPVIGPKLVAVFRPVEQKPVA